MTERTIALQKLIPEGNGYLKLSTFLTICGLIMTATIFGFSMWASNNNDKLKDFKDSQIQTNNKIEALSKDLKDFQVGTASTVSILQAKTGNLESGYTTLFNNLNKKLDIIIHGK